MIYTRSLGLIGGGANMATAMLFTIVSDTVPLEQHTAVFFYNIRYQLVDTCGHQFNHGLPHEHRSVDRALAQLRYSDS